MEKARYKFLIILIIDPKGNKNAGQKQNKPNTSEEPSLSKAPVGNAVNRSRRADGATVDDQDAEVKSIIVLWIQV